MDSAKLILTETVPPPSQLQNLGKIDGIPEEKKEQLAKDFESVLIHKLLDQMKDTIGEWGLEEDGTSKQMKGIFWLYLAGDIANNGGFGMWKDIYQFLTDLDRTDTAGESLDNNL